MHKKESPYEGNTDAELDEEINFLHSSDPVRNFVSAKEKASDMQDSAWIFLVVGFIGFVAAICSIAGILNIPFIGTGFTINNVVFSAIMLLFIGIGFYEFKGARKAASSVDKEQAYIKEVTSWFIDHYDTDTNEDSAASCELYFIRTEKMKAAILKAYPEIEDALLEKLIEDFYHKIYES